MSDYFVIIKRERGGVYVRDPHDYRFPASRWGERAHKAATDYAAQRNSDSVTTEVLDASQYKNYGNHSNDGNAGKSTSANVKPRKRRSKRSS